MILLPIIISSFCNIYVVVLFDIVKDTECQSTQLMLLNILYIILHGFSQPIVMLIFVLLTYRNIVRSRQRVAHDQRIRHNRIHFVSTIFGQIFINAFISLQWIFFFVYYTSTLNTYKTSEKTQIERLILIICMNLYYLNNTKSFYISLLTSVLFRQTFVKSLKTLY